MVSSACPPLGLSALEQQAVLPGWENRAWEALPAAGGAVTQHSAWAWASWALGLTELLF